MIKIEKNFLHQKDFINLERLTLDNQFNYYINFSNSFCFFHHVLYLNGKPTSPFTHLIKSIKEGVSGEIINAFIHMVPKTSEKIKYSFNDNTSIKDTYTAIYYLNNNNGVLDIYDYGEINPEENKLCIYDTNFEAQNFTCTDNTVKSYIYLEFTPNMV